MKYIHSPEEKYNIAFIGNSITKHDKCEYWFGEWGMAASFLNKDYVHLVVNEISKSIDVYYKIFDGSVWEVLSHDRAQALKFYNEINEINYDAIVIQVGENITDTTTLDKDFLEFIHFIKINAPNAKILIIGNFWKNDVIENIKKNVSKVEKVNYISLEDFRSEEYMLKIKGIVMGDDSKEHVIMHQGVAAHPGDKGMQAIAKLILEELF